MGRHLQNIVLCKGINGRHLLYRKVPRGEGTCFVKDNGIRFMECLKIIASLHEDTLFAGQANSPKEAQGNRDNQGAGTRSDQKYQGSIEPVVKNSTKKEGWYDGNASCDAYYDRCIIAGEGRDKVFCGGLICGCIFHQVQNARYG